MIVSVEGMPGVGKSTFARALAERLTNAQLHVPFTPESVEGALEGVPGRRARIWIANIPLAPPRVLVPRISALLNVGNGGIHVFDRHMDSMFALLWAFYGSHGVRYPRKLLYHIVSAYTPKPDLTFFVVGPSTVSTPEKRRLIGTPLVRRQIELMRRAYSFVLAREERVVKIRRGDVGGMVERALRVMRKRWSSNVLP